MKSILSNTMQSYDVFFNPAILVPKKICKISTKLMFVNEFYILRH